MMMEKFADYHYWISLGLSSPWAVIAVAVGTAILIAANILKDKEDWKKTTDEVKAQTEAQSKQEFADIRAELAELRKLVEQLALKLPKN
jgi:hypothetical protein